MELKRMDVEFWSAPTQFSELYQSTGFKYALLSSPNSGAKQCHGWVKCRDFLNDAVRNQLTGKTDSIYGFSYNNGTNPAIDMRCTRLLVKRDVRTKNEASSVETKQMMLCALNILRCFERAGKIKPITRLFSVKSNPDIYVFLGAADWMQSPFLISLYTFLIRLGAKKIEFTTQEELHKKLEEITKKCVENNDHDISYLKITLPYLMKIINNRSILGYIKKDGSHLMEKQPISYFHNCTGIVSLCAPQVNIPELKELSKEIKK
jgi:hypothetical protein